MGRALLRLGFSSKKVISAKPTLNRYWDPHLARRCVKLNPGEQYLSTTGEMLVTVAGSTCVLCLRDPQEGLIAMLNFSLPTDYLSQLDQKGQSHAKQYGLTQLDTLFENLRIQGADLETIEATLVGGAVQNKDQRICVEDTLDFTRRYLAQHGIKVTAEFLGTAHPKKVYFGLDDLGPQVRVLKEVSNTVSNREKRYSTDLQARWLLGHRKTSMQFSA